MTNMKTTKLVNVVDAAWGDTSKTKSSYVESGYTAFSAAGPDGFLEYFDYDQDGIVLSAIGANCGKVYFATGKWSCIKNTMRFLVKDDQELSIKFLYYALSNPNAFVRRGSGQPFIRQQDVRDMDISYPPLSEQHKIVEVLEDHLSRLDAALADVRQAKIKVAQFRKMYIDAFLEGTRGARTTLKKVCSFNSGFAYKSSVWQDSGVPVVKIMNVKNRIVTLEGCSFIASAIAEDSASFAVKKGDLLFNMTGATLGAFGFYNLEQEARLNQRVGKFAPNSENELNLSFLAYFLEATSTQLKIQQLAKGAAQPNISPTDILSLEIYLPDIEKQNVAVRELDFTLSKVTQVDQLCNFAEEESKSLRRSLLQAAFTGQLTKEVASV